MLAGIYPGCTGPKPGRVIQEESSEYPVNSPHICTAESTRELEEKTGSRRYSDSMDMSEGLEPVLLATIVHYSIN